MPTLHRIQRFIVPVFWVVAAACLGFSTVSIAQTIDQGDYQIRRLGLQDGLINQVATAYCTDQLGRMWLGTLNGLYTFDGYKLTRFDNPELGDRHLKHGRIAGLVADTAQNDLIFICTGLGVDAVHATTGALVSDTALGLPGGFFDDCLQIASSGDQTFLWALGHQALYKLYRTGPYRYHLEEVEKITLKRYTRLLQDPNNPESVWILPLSPDVWHYSPEGLRHFDIPGPVAGFNTNPGIISWKYSDQGIFGWDQSRFVYKLNTIKGLIERIAKPNAILDLLPGLSSIDLMVQQSPFVTLETSLDANQKMIGTSLGVFLMRKKTNAFKIIEPLRGEEIRGIKAESSNKWWVGTYDGIYNVNTDNGKLYRYRTKGCVWAFLPLSDQDWLLGMETGNGLMVWDPVERNIQTDTFMTEPVPYNKNLTSVLSLCKDGREYIWAGTGSGLLYAPPAHPLRFQVFLDPETGRPLDIYEARALITDHTGAIWVGAQNGVYRIIYNSVSQQYETDQNIPDFRGVFVSDFYIDRYLNLWLATKKKGLACIDLQDFKKPIKWYTTADGLCNNLTCRIEASHQDRVLWISTHNGLSRLDLDAGIFENYYEDSGFPGNEFNSAASDMAPNGTLFFGGTNGLIQVHPDSVPFTPFRYRTVLSAARVYDGISGTFQEIPLSFTKGISLPPYPEYLEIVLGTNEYVGTEKVRFRYRLRGLSDLWTYTSGEHEIKIIRLQPGSYTFEVQVIPMDGHIGPPVQIPLFIAKPFIETWWFRAILLAIVIGISYFAYRYRLVRVLREQQLRRQVADDLHDDIGNKLNIINILAQKIAQRGAGGNTREGDISDLEKLTDISRKALRSLHTMIWSVDVEKDRLTILLSRMQDFADEYLHPLHIPFRFRIPDTLPDLDVDLTVRYHLILIFQELLTNMVKYTHPTQISVSLELESEQSLRIVLTNEHDPDTDQRFEPFSGNRGQGSIERRLHRLNGQINWLESSETCQVVELKIPRIFKYQ